MIRRVTSSLVDFKTAEFGAGLNLVLADRAPASGDKDSRNGVGKSLLIEIIHFCLGSSLRKESVLSKPALSNIHFTLDFEIEGISISATRNTGDSNNILVDGIPGGWLKGIDHDATLLGVRFNIATYTKLLARHVFGIPSELEGVAHAPTYRSLINVFGRWGGLGAFISPFSTHQSMSTADKQIINTYLLGLGWEYAIKWQQWRDESEAIKHLKRAVKGGAFEGFGRSVGELEPEKVRLSNELRRVRTDLELFQVHHEYEIIERDANRLTREMQGHQNANVADIELLRMYEDSLKEEVDTDPEEITSLFAEAGVLLGDAVRKQLDDVRRFHTAVVANRRDFLRGEIARVRGLVNSRFQAIETADKGRSQLLAILTTHGALLEHSALQQLANDIGAKLSMVEAQIRHFNEIADRDNALKLRQADLIASTRADYQDRMTTRDDAIGIFNENSQYLYNVPGRLIIDIGDNGYDFRVNIEREGSEGIEKMKVFCYDLMLAKLWSSRTPSPRFLIHDSTIFDGVDERQRGHALQRAYHEAINNGFQYIACFSSDALPDQHHMPDVNVVACTRLCLDDTETGSLLGFRF